MSMPSSRLLVATRRGQPPGLQLLLDQGALLAGEAAVVGAGHLLLGQLVEPQGQALGQPPVVDEDERRAVGPDQLEQLGVHRRPDRAPAALAARHLDRVVLLARPAGPARACPPPARPRSGRAPSRSRRRRSRRGAARPSAVLAAQEARDLGERPLGGRQADALEAARRRRPPGAPAAPGYRARCAPRLVPATAWISSTITARMPARISLPARGEQQVQALGGGDEDVGRGAQHALPVALRGVPGAHRHGHRRAPPGPAARRRRRCRPAARAGCARRRSSAPSGARGRAAAPAAVRPAGPATMPFRAHRNAASVLPEPVGARMRLCSPSAIGGQPRSWAGVGAGNARVNHSRTRGWNRASAGLSPPRVRRVVALTDRWYPRPRSPGRPAPSRRRFFRVGHGWGYPARRGNRDARQAGHRAAGLLVWPRRALPRDRPERRPQHLRARRADPRPLHPGGRLRGGHGARRPRSTTPGGPGCGAGPASRPSSTGSSSGTPA